MEYQVTAKYLRMGPRKVRLIADAIRGMKATDAVVVLKSTPKHAAKPVIAAILSAIANAKSQQAAFENLKIMSIDVMGGPALKRWHAASKGMAHPFKRRMSHLKVVLTDGVQKETKVVAVKGGK